MYCNEIRGKIWRDAFGGWYYQIQLHEESHKAERADGNEGSQEHGSKNTAWLTSDYGNGYVNAVFTGKKK